MLMRALFCYLIIFAAFALPSSQANAVSTPTLYVASKNNQVITLMGTIHAARPDFYPIADYVFEALLSADVLVLEVAPQELAAENTRTLISRYGLAVSPSPLRQRVSPAVWQQLAEALNELGVPTGPLFGYRNWLVVLQMSQAKTAQLGYRNDLGIDQFMADQARSLGKPVQGLETAEQQFQLLSQMDQIPPNQLYLGTLEELQLAESWLQRLSQGWQTGNAQQLQKLYAEQQLQGAQQQFMQAVTLQRNENWHAQIQRWPANKRHFVVVGDMHLHGPDNLLDMLRKDGFRVHQLQPTASGEHGSQPATTNTSSSNTILPRTLH